MGGWWHLHQLLGPIYPLVIKRGWWIGYTAGKTIKLNHGFSKNNVGLPDGSCFFLQKSQTTITSRRGNANSEASWIKCVKESLTRSRALSCKTMDPLKWLNCFWFVGTAGALVVPHVGGGENATSTCPHSSPDWGMQIPKNARPRLKLLPLALSWERGARLQSRYFVHLAFWPGIQWMAATIASA